MFILPAEGANTKDKMNDENVSYENPFDINDNVEPESSLPSFPMVQFIAGRKDKEGNGAFGGFFINAQEGIVPQGKEWVKHTMLPAGADSEPVPGFIARSIDITVIRYRRAWFSKPKEGRAKRFGWNDYEAAKAYGKPRGKLHIVAMVGGIDVPVCITLSGTHSADFFDRNGWQSLARRNAYDPIAELFNRPRQASLYFRCVIGVSVGLNGKPAYRVVGSGQDSVSITTIVLYQPTAKVTKQTCAPYVVSRAQAQENVAVYRDTEEWANVWDKQEEEEESKANNADEEIPF